MLLTEYEILIPKNASKPIYFAADELKKFIGLITGAQLEVVEGGSSKKFISLGKTDALFSAKLEVNYNPLMEDGFFIKEKDDCVYIDGNTDRSVIYGGYDFLETYLGIRFYSADTTYMPKHSPLITEKIDRYEIPDIEHRCYMSGDCFGENDEGKRADRDFMSKSRVYNPFTKMDEKYGYKDFLFGRNNSTHNMFYYVPMEKYAKTHPEFYYSEGRELKIGFNEDMTNANSDFTVCLTNGITDDGKLDETMDVSVAKVVIEELKKDVIAHPDIKYYSFEQEDQGYGCGCARCNEAEKKYMRSGILIRFVNVVAEEVNKFTKEQLGGREINITTYAYSYTTAAPMKTLPDGTRVPLDETVIPGEHTVIRLACCGNQFYNLFDERQDDLTKNAMRDWFNISKKIMFWGYDIGFASLLILNLPKANFANAAVGDDIQYTTVNVDSSKATGGYVTNEQLPSAGATKIYLEYVITESGGCAADMGMYGLDETMTNGGNMHVYQGVNARDNYFGKINMRYVYTLDLTTNTASWFVYELTGGESINGRTGKAVTGATWDVKHIALLVSGVLSHEAYEANIDVKAYDDTGANLGVYTNVEGQSYHRVDYTAKQGLSVLTNSIAPSPEATKVYFRYYIVTPEPAQRMFNEFYFYNGDDENYAETYCGENIYIEVVWKTYQCNRNTLTFDLTANTISTARTAKTPTKALSESMYFGLDINCADSAFDTAIFYVKVFDDTGKDLGVRAYSGAFSLNAEEPAGEKTLTEFGLYDNAVKVASATGAVNSNVVIWNRDSAIVDDAALIEKGMHGTALRIGYVGLEASRTIQVKFGRELSAEQISDGVAIKLRSYMQGNDYFRYCQIKSYDGTKSLAVDPDLMSMVTNTTAFNDFILSNVMVNGLTDTDGVFRGFSFTLYSPFAWPSFNFYLDEATYFNSKNVRFYDGATEFSTVSVEKGNTVGVPAEPIKENYLFTGWFTTDGGNVEYDFTSPVNDNIELYAGWVSLSGVQTETFTMNNMRVDNGYFTNKLSPDANATKIYLNYSFVSVNGNMRAGGIYVGDENLDNQQTLYLGGNWILAQHVATAGVQHNVVVDLVTREAFHYYNGTLRHSAVIGGDFDIAHVSMIYYNLDDLGFSHVVTVKAYDNTGKDLLSLHANGLPDDTISAPANANLLTSFTAGDYKATLNVQNVNEISSTAEEIAGKGASDDVLKIYRPVGRAQDITMLFGRELSAADIETKSVRIRAYTINGAYLKYSTLYSFDGTKAREKSNGEDQFMKKFITVNNLGFADYIMTKEEVLSLTDSDGVFRGIKLYVMPETFAWSSFTLYLDEIGTVDNYDVSIVAGEHGSVDVSSVTVMQGTAISVNANVLTIGANVITATAAAEDANYTYAFSNFSGITATVEGALTITANFTATLKQTATIDNYNIEISEDIVVNFYVTVAGYEDVKAYITYNGETLEMPINEGVITFGAVLPQHIGDNIKVELKNGDDVLASVDESVAKYCKKVIELVSYDGYTTAKLDAFKQLATDLLYYGAEVQLYIEHDVENLPTAIVDATPSVFDFNDVNDVYAKANEVSTTYYWYEASVVYDTKLYMSFRIVAPADLTGFKVTIMNAGEQVDVTEFVEVEDLTPGGGLKFYDFTYEISATQFDNALTLTMYNGAEAVGQVLTYSVNSYVKAFEAEISTSAYGALLQRVYLYGASAKAFLDVE